MMEYLLQSTIVKCNRLFFFFKFSTKNKTKSESSINEMRELTKWTEISFMREEVKQDEGALDLA